MNVQSVGDEHTKEFGDAHEEGQNAGSQADRTMDLINNDVSRAVGRKNINASPSVLLDKLLKKASAGEMRVVQDGKVSTLKLNPPQTKAVQAIITTMRVAEITQELLVN